MEAVCLPEEDNQKMLKQMAKATWEACREVWFKTGSGGYNYGAMFISVTWPDSPKCLLVEIGAASASQAS